MQEIFASLAAVGYAAHVLIQRGVMRLHRINENSYGILYSLIATVILFPTIFLFEFPAQPVALLLAATAGVIYAAWSILRFYNVKRTEAPRMVLIDRFEIVCITLLSVLLLGEQLTGKKVVALLLIIAAGTLLSFQKLSFKLDRQALLVILAAFLSASAIIAEKAALDFFEPPLLAFFTYAIPLIVMVAYAGQKVSLHYDNLRGVKKWVAANIAITLCAYLLQLYVLKASTAITTAIIIELYAPLAVIGGIVFLKEKKDLKKVLLATALSLAGTVLVLT